MGNTISYAAIFNQVLDEKFAVLSRTAFMEQNRIGVSYEGGKEVKVPKVDMQGLGDVTGSRIPDGDLTLAYETRQMSFDRGRFFTIDRYDPMDTNFALEVGRVINELYKQKLVPEVDKIRISKVASAAITAGNVSYEGATASSTPLENLLAQIGIVQDKIGEDKELYILMSQTMKTSIINSSEVSRYFNMRDIEIRSINTRVEAINDHPIIGVPSRYMYSAFNKLDGTTSGQEDGGLTPASGAKEINWIIIAADSALAVAFPRVEKIFSPDINQVTDGWRFGMRMRHDCWVWDNKLDGILVNVKGAAPTT